MVSFEKLIHPKHSAILVIDVQNDFCHPEGGQARQGLDISAMTAVVPNIGNQNVVQATDVFTSKAEVGQRVVVIGGRLRGMEVADLLANQGKKVSLVTLKALGENGSPVDRHILRQMKKRLLELDVTLFPYSSVYEIREKGVYINYSQDLIFLEADTVVLAVGTKPENHIVFELKGVVPELYAIGDCVTPRDAMHAICEGAEIGRKI